MVISCNAFEIYAMVNVLLDIDLANGYLYMVVLFHCWNTFFPFNLIGFGVDVYMFG
jgi:hypothetical protein